MKGFLCRRCWKPLDGRDPFPVTQCGPAHTRGAQQIWTEQRYLILGHPSAQWAMWGNTEERAPSLETDQWGASAKKEQRMLLVCHSFIQTHLLGIYCMPAPGLQ